MITGKRAIVYVETPEKPGTFAARSVLLGPRAKGYYVVQHGLNEGEKVVVNGSFKIDSAVQILAKPSMMEHKGGEPMSGHQDHVGSQPMKMEMQVAPPGTQQPAVKPAVSRRDQMKNRMMKLKPKSQ